MHIHHIASVQWPHMAKSLDSANEDYFHGGRTVYVQQ